MWCKTCGEIVPVVRSSGRTNWYACPLCLGEVHPDRLTSILSSLQQGDRLWLQNLLNVQAEKLRLAQEQCQRLWEILQEDK